MTVEQALVLAINSKSSIEVQYDGHIRHVSPIRFGWKTTEDEGLHKNLFCYQFGGYSSRGLSPDGSEDNFRCWKLEDITYVAVIPGIWHGAYALPRERSTCIDTTIAST
jgi:hypothetical protein